MPSTPTEAKHTPLPWAADAPDWYGDINIVPTHESLVIGSIVRNGFRSDVETAANAALIVKCVNERASLLSLIEDMAKALGAMRTVMDKGSKPTKLDEAMTWRQCDEKANAMCDTALSRYTEFLRALSAQEGSTNA